jgi:uncharacterized protein (TIGR02757 family)
MAGLSQKRAERLRPLLLSLAGETLAQGRVGFDPIEFPRRFQDKRDIEVVAFLSASLAYGRADLFREKIAQLVAQMGRTPAAWVQSLTVTMATDALRGFVYRFNVASDIAVLLLGLGGIMRAHGSLEALFLTHFDGRDLRSALQGMTRAIVAAAPVTEIETRMGPVRGMAHLLPGGGDAGAFKRLNMFLRWMVRGPDLLDFGIWTQVSPTSLVIPLDTHVARLGWNLGLTSRKTHTWPMAVEITESLRRIDAADPVRFDFALCHFGMSGGCPVKVRRETCRTCLFRDECRIGRRYRNPKTG